jgi:hypothetical protein
MRATAVVEKSGRRWAAVIAACAGAVACALTIGPPGDLEGSCDGSIFCDLDGGVGSSKDTGEIDLTTDAVSTNVRSDCASTDAGADLDSSDAPHDSASRDSATDSGSPDAAFDSVSMDAGSDSG